METQASVSGGSRKGKNTIWFVAGGLILACCCGVAVIAGVAGLFVYTSASTTASNPITSTTDVTPQVGWLVTADELNTFSNEIGIVEWQLAEETPGEYRVCHTFSGVSWSVNANQASNCIAQTVAGNSLDMIIKSLFESGELYSDEVPVDVSLNLDGEYALYTGSFPNGHTVFDLLLLQNGLLYWASVTLGTPAGITPVELYQSEPQVIQGFLENMLQINLQRSQ